MIDRQPVLAGAKVKLRPLETSDWDPLYAVASDQEIWAQHPYWDRYKEAVFKEFFDQAMDSRGALAIIDQVNGAIIGSSRFGEPEADGTKIEIGWTFFATQYWRTGHNRETKALMLRHIFQFFNVVVFRVGKSNLRSCRAVERLGATLFATEAREYHGKHEPHRVYQLTRSAAAKGALALQVTK